MVERALSILNRDRARNVFVVPRKAVTVRLEPDDADKLRNLCGDRECSYGALITEWIQRADDLSGSPE